MGRNPAVSSELLRFLMHIDRRRTRPEVAKEIRLLLPVATMLADFFVPHVLRIEIAVSSTVGDHVVVMGFQPDFFLDFAEKRLFQRFAHVHSTLGKLPSTRDRGTLANQQPPSRIDYQGGDVLAVANHESNLNARIFDDNP